MKHFLTLPLLLTLMIPAAFSQQENLLSAAANPFATFPLGSSSNVFKSGSGVDASVTFIPGFSKYFGAIMGADYLSFPLASSPDSGNSIWAISG